MNNIAVLGYRPLKPYRRSERLAVRHNGVLLSCPRMHPDTPSVFRQQVWDLILRRQPGEASMIAEEINYYLDRRRPLPWQMPETDDQHIARVKQIVTDHRADRRPVAA